MMTALKYKYESDFEKNFRKKKGFTQRILLKSPSSSDVKPGPGSYEVVNIGKTHKYGNKFPKSTSTFFTKKHNNEDCNPVTYSNKSHFQPQPQIQHPTITSAHKFSKSKLQTLTSTKPTYPDKIYQKSYSQTQTSRR